MTPEARKGYPCTKCGQFYFSEPRECYWCANPDRPNNATERDPNVRIQYIPPPRAARKRTRGAG